MTVLDWAIVAFTLALGIWGYRQGLIVGALTLLGFGLGAFLGSRLGPIVLSQGAHSPYAPLCGAIGALLVGALTAVMLEGIALGLRRKVIRHRFMHHADGAGGAALIGAVALGLAWIFGAVALHAPGTTQLRGDVQNSVILKELDQVMPPSGGVLTVLDRVDPSPAITGPATPRQRPDAAIAEDPRIVAAGGAVVRVLSTACQLGIEGSGWAIRPNLIVTNAHVVAGADDTTVTTAAGVELDATAVYYEPKDDLALLKVDAKLPTLPVDPGDASGAEAAVLGYPENGPYTVTPARVGETRTTISEDSYGRGPIERTITALGGDVRSGNSGGPLLDAQGEVVGVVFAATTSGPPGGFAVPAAELAAAVEAAGNSRVSTGACAG